MACSGSPFTLIFSGAGRIDSRSLSSVAWAILFIMATAPAGYFPTAVSPDNIIASVPSTIALATSEASARVGLGCCIIDSSIWVAVITGIVSSLHRLMISFWMIGTCSREISTPRSPLATIIPSATFNISSKFSMASGFSIFAMTGIEARSRLMISFTERTSSAVLIKEMATKSTPSAIPVARSSLSLSVRLWIASFVPGTLIPLFLRKLPAADNLTVDLRAADLPDIELQQPIVHQDTGAFGQVPGKAFIICGYDHTGSKDVASRNDKRLAFFQEDSPLFKLPDPDLGPLKVE